MTYGLKRVEILSAQINGVTLLVLALVISFEAVRRLFEPPDVEGGLVLAVAIVGIGVNLAAVWTLARANRTSLNVEGSFQHILTDLYAFIATAIAGALVLWMGWLRADPIASLLVAALMLRAAYGLLRDSGRVFLEAAPTGLDPDEIGRTLVAQPDVREVHDLHVWEISSGFPRSRRTCWLPTATATRRAGAGRPARRALRDRAHDAPGRPRATAQALQIAAREERER